MSVTLADIQQARARIRDAIYHSPCPHSLALSRLCGSTVHCKLDNLQMTGSFKERGARNALLQLSPTARACGVIAASAGNHALGLAYHGQLLGLRVCVVMPREAPLVKIGNCRGFGAEVILHGESYDEARAQAEVLAEQRGMTFIHGFDDDHIIAGQGSLGLEILEDVPQVDAVIVPVGGGGLISGIGLAIKELRPQVRIIGVQSANAPTLYESLRRGSLTRVATRPTLADGLAVAQAGGRCFDIAKRVVDSMVLVDEAQIASAVLRLMELEKTVVEGAGAAAAAAILGGTLGLAGKTVVLVLAGGNIDVTVLSRIIERGLAQEGRLARIEVQLRDRPGSLASLLALIADNGASITQVVHDRNFGPADVAQVSVELVMETRDHGHIAQVHAALRQADIQFSSQSIASTASSVANVLNLKK